MKKIIFTGGSGKFGKVFKKFNSNKKNIYFPSSKTFDVTNQKKMENFIKIQISRNFSLMPILEAFLLANKENLFEAGKTCKK